jgi:hypothetical protein
VETKGEKLKRVLAAFQHHCLIKRRNAALAKARKKTVFIAAPTVTNKAKLKAAMADPSSFMDTLLRNLKRSPVLQ